MYQLHDILQKIKTQPGEYIGGKSLSHLKIFIAGYSFNENPEQDSFNNFCKVYYADSSSIDGWQMILNYCNGNEEAAFDEFFRVYERYFTTNNLIDSRYILYQLLYLFLIETRALSNEKNHEKAFKITNLIHNLPLKLYNTLSSRILPEYDEILEKLVDDALKDEYLTHFIFGNFPELNGCYWEFWRGKDSASLMNKRNTDTPVVGETKIKEFFCISYEKAKKIAYENP